MSKICDKLKGGDLRSIGKAEEVVTDILNDKNLFTEVFNGMLSDDALIRMRSADAIEKVSRLYPEYLQPFKQRLIDEISQVRQQEVRWHIAQMFSRLEFQKEEISQVVSLLIEWIDNSQSKIVKVNSLQALTDIAKKYNEIMFLAINKIEEVIVNGSPAMISRGKKLLKELAE
jgi:hypothetical protein